jgi:hypothetical protein
MRTADGVDQRLDSKTLQYLKDEALEFDGNDELAALAADEVGDLSRPLSQGPYRSPYAGLSHPPHAIHPLFALFIRWKKKTRRRRRTRT